MKYIFVGQNILGGKTLKSLVVNDCYPELVVTRTSNDYVNLVELMCNEFEIQHVRTSDISQGHIVDLISQKGPDIAFCCSWGDRISPPLLNMPPLGWVNFHPSYLPAYRGPRPIEWQLINGEEYGGCTAHSMSFNFDEGPIILQERIKINIDDDGETMRLKCGKILGSLAVRCYQLFQSDPSFEGIEQEASKATYAPPRENIREIDWDAKAMQIYNLVRGLSPYPCAILHIDQQEVLLARVAITNMRSDEHQAGNVQYDDDKKLLVGANDFYIKVLAIRQGSNIVDNYSTTTRGTNNEI